MTVVKEYKPENADAALRTEVSNFEGAPSSDLLEDFLADAASLIIKRDSEGGPITGFLIVTIQTGPGNPTYFISIMKPEGDKELLDKAHELYKDARVILNVDGAKAYIDWIKAKRQAGITRATLGQKLLPEIANNVSSFLGGRKRRTTRRRSTRRKQTRRK